MRPKDDSLIKQLLRTSNGSTTVVASTPWWRDKLICPTTNVKGDRRSPNTWSYIAETSTNWSGKALEYAGNFGSGPNPLQAEYNGQLYNIPQPSIDDQNRIDQAYNTALGRLNEKVRGGLDISVAVAESHQTMKMVKAIGKVERYITGIGPRRWANEWLAFKYGWLPLVSDVHAAAEELINVSRAMSKFKARAHVRTTPELRLTSQAEVDISGVSNYTQGPVTSVHKGEAFSAVALEIVLDLPSALHNKARWSSLNPVAIGWELVPYSFVVDWFIDIGSFLRDLETYWLFNDIFRGGYKSSLYRCQLAGTCGYSEFFVANYFTRVKAIAAKRDHRKTQFDRVLLSNYPGPNLPRVNTDLSSGRLITAAALLAQRLPVPAPVKAAWYSQMVPFISYGQLKKPRFRFKPEQRWHDEMRWGK